MHGSYLQGMETDDAGNTVILVSDGTDPTYKEWKLSIATEYDNQLVKHGSYLQGMETRWALHVCI